jgi:glycosyltransferase involved in cell wall biosynthesis
MAADISVIVPSYNRMEYLDLALRSALNQTVKEFEVLVVDDASTDGSVAMVEQMQKEDSRLRLLALEKNIGIAATRNTGIQNCTTKYVTFLDSDDLFARERIETLYSRLGAGEGRSVVYTDWITVHKADIRLHAEPCKGSFRPEGMIFPQLLGGGFRFTGGLIALPRKCFDEVGFYDGSLRWAEDTDMALRLSTKFPFLFERLSSYGWRSHRGSSSIVIGKRMRLSEQSRVLERHILDNLDILDSSNKRKAFNRLFGCYVGSGQWKKLLKMSMTDRQAFVALLTTPRRMMRNSRDYR